MTQAGKEKKKTITKVGASLCKYSKMYSNIDNCELCVFGYENI